MGDVSVDSVNLQQLPTILQELLLLEHSTDIAVSLKSCNRRIIINAESINVNFVCNFASSPCPSQIHPESWTRLCCSLGENNVPSFLKTCNNRTNAAFTGLVWYSERRGETSAGGAAQGRGGAPEAGERPERQRGQGGSAEGQMGQGEELSNRATEVGPEEMHTG